MMASALSTRSQPGGGTRMAASSASPSAPGCEASGRKWRAISRSSPEPSACAIASARGTVELGRPQLPRQHVEHRIDHAGLLAVEKRAGDVDVFRDDDAGGNVAALIELEGAGSQYGAQQRLHALERPPARECAIDQRIEAALLAQEAADDLTKEPGLGRQIFRTLDLAAEPVALELRQDVVERGRRDIHLVERLHRREPRGAAAAGLAPGPGRGRHRRLPEGASRRLIRSMASAARTASPPLSASSTRARAQACNSVSTVRMPLPTGRRRATARSISARADSVATMSKCMVSPRMTQPSATTPS